MKILLDKAKINYPQVQKFAHKTSADELMKLSEPCYYPAHQKYYFQFLHYYGLTQNDTREFPKRFWSGRPGITRIHKDPIRMFYVFVLHTLLTDKTKRGAYPSIMLLIGIREYSNLMYKMIKYCNEDLFRYALEHLAKTHLFSREKTIGNSLYYLSKEMVKRFTTGIQEGDKDQISKFIQEYRSRISQSIKSFATVYYKAAKEGTKIKVEIGAEEDQYQYDAQDRSERVIDEIVKKITVYKEFDKKAMLDAKKLTKISTSLATQLSVKLRDTKYTDNIRTCLKLFIKDLKSVTSICGKGYYPYVKKLMGIKRTRERVYFKQQVHELLMLILKDIKYSQQYDSLTNQTKFSINSYLAYYLTMILRNTICGLTEDKRALLKR